ncbi:hypothetical protein GUITHDRAFT_101266 [Guillardia theta CCMP2712]|uniref:HEAT repeat-containing protein n=3 Tax=Guillardia theta TaxID=55529 RepID=L1JXA1_GUITC|nr:hypothetical protein GUITHDRAFT_101266 [Guillardia theta CCMP2712]EKX52815.1 hypothetical protein GUITHDRAFT_101266 [Guillardia theta CCMP2712]|eukprot:XP_005839795.1 hypothetical protein GUITHDRAFT_101266 [Guillardia theta CCMP2712]
MNIPSLLSQLEHATTSDKKARAIQHYLNNHNHHYTLVIEQLSSSIPAGGTYFRAKYGMVESEAGMLRQWQRDAWLLHDVVRVVCDLFTNEESFTVKFAALEALRRLRPRGDETAKEALLSFFGEKRNFFGHKIEAKHSLAEKALEVLTSICDWSDVHVLFRLSVLLRVGSCCEEMWIADRVDLLRSCLRDEGSGNEVPPALTRELLKVDVKLSTGKEGGGGSERAGDDAEQGEFCKDCMLLLSNPLEEEEAALMRDGLHYFGPCAKANSVFSQAREIVDDVPLESLCCDVKVEDEVMDYDPMQTGAPRGFKLTISSETGVVEEAIGRAVYHPRFSNLVLPLQELMSDEKGLQSPVLMQLYTWGGAELGEAMYDVKNRVYRSSWHPPLSLRWEPVGGVVLSTEFLLRERKEEEVVLVLENDVELTWEHRHRVFRDWRSQQHQSVREEKRREEEEEGGRRREIHEGREEDRDGGGGRKDEAAIEYSKMDSAGWKRGSSCKVTLVGLRVTRGKRLFLNAPLQPPPDLGQSFFLIAENSLLQKGLDRFLRDLQSRQQEGKMEEENVEHMRATWRAESCIVQPRGRVDPGKSRGILFQLPCSSVEEGCIRAAIRGAAEFEYSQFKRCSAKMRRLVARLLIKIMNPNHHVLRHVVDRYLQHVEKEGRVSESLPWKVVKAACLAGLNDLCVYNRDRMYDGKEGTVGVQLVWKGLVSSLLQSFRCSDESVRIMALRINGRLLEFLFRSGSIDRFFCSVRRNDMDIDKDLEEEEEEEEADSSVSSHHRLQCKFRTSFQILRRALRDRSSSVKQDAVHQCQLLHKKFQFSPSWLLSDLQALIQDKSEHVRTAALHCLASLCPSNRLHKFLAREEGRLQVGIRIGVESLTSFRGQACLSRMFVTLSRLNRLPPLQVDLHQWHPPLIWTWEEVGRTGWIAERGHERKNFVNLHVEEEGVRAEHALDVSYSSLLLHGLEDRLWVRCWEQPNQRLPPELVGEANVPAHALLRVDKHRIEARGARISLLVQCRKILSSTMASEWGSANLFFVIRGGAASCVLYASEVRRKEEEVEFSPVSLSLERLSPSDSLKRPWTENYLSSLLLELWDWDVSRQHRFLGSCEMPLDELHRLSQELVAYESAVEEEKMAMEEEERRRARETGRGGREGGIVPMEQRRSKEFVKPKLDFSLRNFQLETVGLCEVAEVELTCPEQWHAPLSRAPYKDRDGGLLFIHQVAFSSDPPAPISSPAPPCEDEERRLRELYSSERAASPVGVLNVLGVEGDGNSFDSADPSWRVRQAAVRVLSELSSTGEEATAAGLLSGCADQDAEVRALAVEGYSRRRFPADRDAVEELIRQVRSGQYLEKNNLELADREWRKVRERALLSLPRHASRGKVSILLSSGRKCALSIERRAKEEKMAISQLTGELEEVNEELERHVAKERGEEWERKMKRLLKRKAVTEREIESSQLSLAWLLADLERTWQGVRRQRHRLFLLTRALELEASGGPSSDVDQLLVSSSEDQLEWPRDWHPPLLLPRPPRARGKTLFFFRFLSELEDLCGFEFLLPHRWEQLQLLEQMEEETRLASFSYFSHCFAWNATWLPGIQLGSSGSLAPGEVLEGELVTCCLWCPPFERPWKGGKDVWDSSLMWNSAGFQLGEVSAALELLTFQDQELQGKIAVVALRTRDADAELVSQIVTKAKRKKARGVVLISLEEESFQGRFSVVQSTETIPILCAEDFFDHAWMSASLESDDEIFDAVVAALQDPHEQVRSTACQALGNISQYPSGKGRWSRGSVVVLHHLCELLLQDPSPLVRASCVKAISMLGPSRNAEVAAAVMRAVKREKEGFLHEQLLKLLSSTISPGEEDVHLNEQAARAKEAHHGALLSRHQAASVLSDLLFNNIDLQIARQRTFDIYWTMSSNPRLTCTWPAHKFQLNKGKKEDSETLSAPSFLSPELLAWAGWFFSPDEDAYDRCCCFCCGAWKSDWRRADDPLSFHEQSCLYKICALPYADERFLQVPPPRDSQRKLASKSTCKMNWRIKIPTSLELQLGLPEVGKLAGAVEASSLELEYHSAILRSNEEKMKVNVDLALEVAQAAFGLLGRVQEESALLALNMYVQSGCAEQDVIEDDDEASLPSLPSGAKVVEGVRAGVQKEWLAVRRSMLSLGQGRRRKLIRAIADYAR